jgi:transcriptional regulator of acetoin/glycerol metabolism
MIAAQSFREDLYYRLNGLVVRVPALRERSDFVTIVRKILRAGCAGCPPELDDEVLCMLQRYAWPGNIRQLANVLRTAAVMAAGEPLITRAHLSDDFIEDAGAALPVPARAASSAVTQPPADAVAPAAPSDTAATLEELELQTIKRALEEAGGNISVASKRLGISRNTIYRKLRWRQDA